MELSTWDIGVLSAAGIIAVYCFLLRRHKALTLLVAAYVAYVIALLWGFTLSELLTGERAVVSNVWIQANVAPHMVQIGLFTLVLVLTTSFMKLGGKRGRYGLLETALYSISAVGVAITSALLYLPVAERALLSEKSFILPFLFTWANWIMLVPVMVIAFFGIISGDDQV
jgi:hypothetical protein